MTKFAKLILDPNTIRYELEKALHLATSGRPGPCWLDIPVDVQAAQIDPGDAGWLRARKGIGAVLLPENVGGIVGEVLEKSTRRSSPVLLIGTGVRLAGALDLLEIADVLKIPVATAWTPDLLSTENPYYCGRQEHHRHACGKFHGAECRLRADARRAHVRPAGQLQLEIVRALRL